MTSKSHYLLLNALLPAILSGLFFIPPSQARQVEELDRIIAVVNKDVITRIELDKRIQLLKKQLKAKKTQLPPESVFRKQVLERLILEQIQLQMAQQRGIRVNDETINGVITDIARENKLSLDGFRKVLSKDGVSFAEFRENIKNNIMMDRLKGQIVNKEVTITKQEVDTYLEKTSKDGDQQTEYKLSHILIAIPEAATPKQIEDSKTRAEKILKQLRNGADFAKTAIASSDDQQALKGGQMDWLRSAQMPDLFADEIVSMKTGQLSKLIRSPSGFHIVRLDKKRSSSNKHIVKQTLVRHILIKPNTVLSDQAAKQKLEKIRQQIAGGADFAKLAKTHSDDKGSALNGGSLGWSSPGKFVPSFEKTMNKLKQGELSEVFRSQFGWHLMQVMSRRKHDDSDEYNRTQIQKMIHNRKANEAIENWLRRIRDEAYVEYYLDN